MIRPPAGLLEHRRSQAEGRAAAAAAEPLLPRWNVCRASQGSGRGRQRSCSSGESRLLFLFCFFLVICFFLLRCFDVFHFISYRLYIKNIVRVDLMFSFSLLVLVLFLKRLEKRCSQGTLSLLALSQKQNRVDLIFSPFFVRRGMPVVRRPYCMYICVMIGGITFRAAPIRIHLLFCLKTLTKGWVRRATLFLLALKNHQTVREDLILSSLCLPLSCLVVSCLSKGSKRFRRHETPLRMKWPPWDGGTPSSRLSPRRCPSCGNRYVG